MLKSRGAAIPYLIWMFLFTVLPLGIIVVYAFTTADGSFTMGNIVAVGDYISVIFRSVWLSAIATAICLLMAYPLAFIISRAKAGNQKMYLTL
ncbi:MAG: ABC transporter permease, partial [Oscillospiraceae bacterium]